MKFKKVILSAHIATKASISDTLLPATASDFVVIWIVKRAQHHLRLLLCTGEVVWWLPHIIIMVFTIYCYKYSLHFCGFWGRFRESKPALFEEKRVSFEVNEAGTHTRGFFSYIVWSIAIFQLGTVTHGLLNVFNGQNVRTKWVLAWTRDKLKCQTLFLHS